MMLACYSGKLLRDKLGIKEGFKIIILNPPQDYDKALGRLPERVVVMKEFEGPLDFIHFFTKKRDDLEESFPRLKRGLSQKGML